MAPLNHEQVRLWPFSQTITRVPIMKFCARFYRHGTKAPKKPDHLNLFLRQFRETCRNLSCSYTQPHPNPNPIPNPFPPTNFPFTPPPPKKPRELFPFPNNRRTVADGDFPGKGCQTSSEEENFFFGCEFSWGLCYVVLSPPISFPLLLPPLHVENQLGISIPPPL